MLTALGLLATADRTAAQDSGTTGTCDWVLTGPTDNRTLTIRPTDGISGEMADYYSYSAPWGDTENKRTNLKTLIIEPGVTRIGKYAFPGCAITGPLSLPESLISIGDTAFSRCINITGTLSLPESLITIGNSAFSNCDGLTGPLTIPDKVTSIGENGFYGCRGFTGRFCLAG